MELEEVLSRRTPAWLMSLWILHAHCRVPSGQLCEPLEKAEGLLSMPVLTLCFAAHWTHPFLSLTIRKSSCKALCFLTDALQGGGVKSRKCQASRSCCPRKQEEQRSRSIEREGESDVAQYPCYCRGSTHGNSRSILALCL